MSFPIFIFPSPTFDAVESALRAGGFAVERPSETKDRNAGLIVRAGLARALVADLTEKEDKEVHYVVLKARDGPLRAFFWPVDFWLERRIDRNLSKAGARYFDPEKAEDA